MEDVYVYINRREEEYLQILDFDRADIGFYGMTPPIVHNMLFVRAARAVMRARQFEIEYATARRTAPPPATRAFNFAKQTLAIQSPIRQFLLHEPAIQIYDNYSLDAALWLAYEGEYRGIFVIPEPASQFISTRINALPNNVRFSIRPLLD